MRDRIIGKAKAAWNILKGSMVPSFSQAGEDRIIYFFFATVLKREVTSYIDIGANHPILNNNTFLFYSRGGSGILVEPDSRLIPLLRKHRRRDILLHAGIGFGENSVSEFYQFSSSNAAWNTFSREEAEKRRTESGEDFVVLKQNLLNINDVMSRHFKNELDVMSIDAEGIDFQILNSMDFARYRPNLICVESLTFVDSKVRRSKLISDLLEQSGYILYADTHVNSIFCRKEYV
jgi:hypothetical protein